MLLSLLLLFVYFLTLPSLFTFVINSIYICDAYIYMSGFSPEILRSGKIAHAKEREPRIRPKFTKRFSSREVGSGNETNKCTCNFCIATHTCIKSNVHVPVKNLPLKTTVACGKQVSVTVPAGDTNVLCT